MAKRGVPQGDMTVIGEIAKPVFARLPDPRRLFQDRAARFRFLADGHDLRPYLLFLAGLSEAQDRVQDSLPEPVLPDPAALKRAHDFAMPPLDGGRFAIDATFTVTLQEFLPLLADLDMPDAAAAALARLRGGKDLHLAEMARSVLSHAIPMAALAEHVYVAAALQVHFARLASRLDAATLVPVGDGACPVCGGPPVSSMVVGWQGAHGTRYCACATCGTLWNYVRIKCTLCGSTEGISYQEVEGGPGTVKAETCRKCHGYVKILQQHIDPAVDPVADDVASLGLDLLVRDTGFKRGAVNAFLLGY
jgi:FdhE protein